MKVTTLDGAWGPATHKAVSGWKLTKELPFIVTSKKTRAGEPSGGCSQPRKQRKVRGTVDEGFRVRQLCGKGVRCGRMATGGNMTFWGLGWIRDRTSQHGLPRGHASKKRA